MNSLYFQHSLEKIGEELHLIVLITIWIIVAVKNYNIKPKASKFIIIGLLIMIFSIVCGGVHRALIDSKFVHENAENVQFSKMVIFSIISGLHFLSEIFSWILLIIAWKKLIKNQ